MTAVPAAGELILKVLPFVAGVFLSSCSEDILTRGYIYFHLKERIGNLPVILVSALVYWLNHIYKLGTGPGNWIYIILLGVIFMIPVMITRSLWFTTAMHWAGNSVFFVTHQAIDTETLPSRLQPNDVLSFCILGLIPLVVYFLRSAYSRNAHNGPPAQS
ncbi:CPBP family intramembrane glutamic endopeptidase [Puia sp. P3]|uniref:CPBP family intramembrane glutamic endopeptidase n=1 Tax=Puia sp. P3 TaxID=3423952 RepID=UPI003D66ED86